MKVTLTEIKELKHGILFNSSTINTLTGSAKIVMISGICSTTLHIKTFLDGGPRITSWVWVGRRGGYNKDPSLKNVGVVVI